MPGLDPVIDPQATPVQARRGTLVHATSLQTPRRTACGYKCDGWVVAIARVACKRCQIQLLRGARGSAA